MRPGTHQSWSSRYWSRFAVSLAAGVLLLLPGLLGIALGRVWLFPSLGPTAFLIVVFPRSRSSGFYNTLVGHLIGMAAGFIAVYLLVAEGEPSVLATGALQPRRMLASSAAVFLTILGQQTTRSLHAPAAATTLLITLGGFHANLRDAAAILAGVLLLAVAGIAVRHWAGAQASPEMESPK